MYPLVCVLQSEYQFEFPSFSLPLSELLSFHPTPVRACLHHFSFDSIETIGRKRTPRKTPAPVLSPFQKSCILTRRSTANSMEST